MSSVVHKAILKLFPTKEELCEIVAGCVTPLEAWDKKSVLELPITSLLKVSIYPLVPLTHLSAPVKGGSVWGVFSTPAGLVPKIVISPHALDGDTPRLRVSLPELLGDKPTYSSVHSLTLDEWKSRDFTEIVIRRIEESLLQMAATPFLYNNKWHKSIMGG